MQIECTIRRPSGTTVEIDGTNYHFAPEVAGGAHVAKVTDEAHQAAFLAVEEAYREVGNYEPATGEVGGDDTPRRGRPSKAKE